MINKAERFSEEKIYVNSYESLVNELARGMRIDDEKILPKEDDEFDYEDIFSWIKAVDFADKKPKIEASLSGKKGKNPITIDVEKQGTIRSENEKVSGGTLLYSIALTEAKMKVISDIAEETYPAVAFQIKEYKKEMEKVKEVILGSREVDDDLNETLKRTAAARRAKAINTLIVVGLILAACTKLPPVSTSETKTQTQPVATEVNPVTLETIEPTIEVTPTVTATATEIAQSGEVSAERQKEIISNVNAFINAEGQYSEAELRKNPNWFELDVDPNEPLPLGFLDTNVAQAILVDYVRIGDVVHLFMGTYDNNGKRIVIDYPTSTRVIPVLCESQSGMPGNETIIEGAGELEGYLTTLDKYVGNPLYFLSIFEETSTLEGASQDIIDMVDFVNGSLEYAKDIFYLFNKKNINPGLVIKESRKQGDDVMSVNYFGGKDQMEITDFETIKSEKAEACMEIVFRNP